LCKAAGYVLNQQRALRRFLEDGRLPLDNTLVERRLRPVATGRAVRPAAGDRRMGDLPRAARPSVRRAAARGGGRGEYRDAERVVLRGAPGVPIILRAIVERQEPPAAVG
jgi:hypothetical protein